MSIDEKYEIQNKIGSGSFGNVYKGIRKTDGTTVAIKVIKKSKLNQAELEIMKIANQDCSVKYFEEFDEDENKIIIMSYFNGYDLHDYVNNCYSESDMYRNKAFLWFVELKDCIDSLHAKGIYHRDIKLENIMLQNNIPKIIDYGLAYYDDGKSDIDIVGSPDYYSKWYLQLKEDYPREIKIQILRFHDYYCLISTIYALFTRQFMTRTYSKNRKNMISEIKSGLNLKPILVNSSFMELAHSTCKLLKKFDLPTEDFFNNVNNFYKNCKEK